MLDGIISTFSESYLWKGLLSITSFDGVIGALNNAGYYIIDFFFGWIHLPQMPATVLNSINGFLDLIFNNLGLLSFFVRFSTVKLVLGLVLAVWGFKYGYRIVLWILKKIPFVGIE